MRNKQDYAGSGVPGSLAGLEHIRSDNATFSYQIGEVLVPSVGEGYIDENLIGQPSDKNLIETAALKYLLGRNAVAQATYSHEHRERSDHTTRITDTFDLQFSYKVRSWASVSLDAGHVLRRDTTVIRDVVVNTLDLAIKVSW